MRISLAIMPCRPTRIQRATPIRFNPAFGPLPINFLREATQDLDCRCSRRPCPDSTSPLLRTPPSRLSHHRTGHCLTCLAPEMDGTHLSLRDLPLSLLEPTILLDTPFPPSPLIAQSTILKTTLPFLPSQRDMNARLPPRSSTRNSRRVSEIPDNSAVFMAAGRNQTRRTQRLTPGSGLRRYHRSTLRIAITDLQSRRDPCARNAQSTRSVVNHVHWSRLSSRCRSVGTTPAVDRLRLRTRTVTAFDNRATATSRGRRTSRLGRRLPTVSGKETKTPRILRQTSRISR